MTWSGPHRLLGPNARSSVMASTSFWYRLYNALRPIYYDVNAELVCTRKFDYYPYVYT